MIHCFQGIFWFRLLVVQPFSLFLRNRLPAHGIAVPVAGWVLAGGAVGEPVGTGAYWFTHCTARQNPSGHWDGYTVGGEAIS